MKAISLFSGGLDSQLAAKTIQQQNIIVIGLHFISPFFGADARTRAAAQDLGLDLHIIHLDEDYLEKVLRKPVYGYGKNMNPCIDCHGYMLRQAGEYLVKFGASFLVTGEVVGQRPMSQNKSALNAVDKLSGYKGYIVRPLSGQLLEPTIPEKNGWIERSRLLDINGRSRTRQMELADYYGIKDYPAPAGGCLLTEANYVRRLKKVLDLIPNPYPQELEVLRVGRHFYLYENTLLVIGRNHSENQRIQQLAAATDILLKVQEYPGPLALIRLIAPSPAEDLVDDSLADILANLPLHQTAAAILARYSDAKDMAQVMVKVFDSAGQILALIDTCPLAPDKVPASV